MSNTASNQLKEVTEEEARELFGNYSVYFINEKGKLECRSWWQKVENRYHQFPQSSRYFVQKFPKNGWHLS